jgi:hypothetical protein
LAPSTPEPASTVTFATPATPATAATPVAPAPPPAWPDVAAPLAGAIEGALAIGARAVARLSSQAGGIRFGTVQKLDHQYRTELQSIRTQAGVEGGDPADVVRRLRALLEQVERFAGQWIPPPAPAPATADQGVPGPADPAREGAGAPVPLAVQQVAAIRQGVTRAMIALASAPLHLRLEFGPGFADPHPDVLLLAARMHAIHRAVRGSLKQVCWEAIDRAGLLFGDADPGDAVEATFDAQGRLRVPDAVRQNAGRGPAGAASRGASGPRATSAPSGGRRTGRPPPPARDGRQPAQHGGPSPGPAQPRARQGRPPAGQVPPSSRQGPPPSPRQGPPPSRQAGPPPSRQGPPPGADRSARPSGRGQPRPATGGGPASARATPGGAGRTRDDRLPPKPRAPVNSLMADKLRAVLAGASGPATAPDTAGPPAPAKAPERGSD